MKNLVRIFKPLNAEFVYHEAKYDAVREGETSPSGKTWFSTPLKLSDIGQIKYNPEFTGDTLDELDALVQRYRDQKVILLGFSQGGNVVDAYLAYRYDESSAIVSAAIIISGYSLVDSSRPVVSVPALMVVGETDTIVKPELHPTAYSNMQVLTHPDSHIIPKSEYVRKMLEFVNVSVQSV